MEERWKRVPIPAELWERLKTIAEKAGIPVSRLLREWLSENLPKVAAYEEVQICVFCGKPSDEYQICRDCYYDPEIVRPQIMAVLYLDFALRILQSTGHALGFDDFIAVMDEETAKAHKVHEKEWAEWLEWLEWRKRHKEDPTAKDSIEWRKWVREHPVHKSRHAGRLLFTLKWQGRSDLQAVGEILQQTFPNAFKGQTQ